MCGLHAGWLRPVCKLTLSVQSGIREAVKIQLSDHFTYKKIFRFVLPSIAMMVFTSIYGIVDGFFVSNFAGKTAFAAVNFIIPFIMILSSVGYMFGTGGCALVSKNLGEGNIKKAQQTFSLIVCVSFAVGIILAAAVDIIFLFANRKKYRY